MTFEELARLRNETLDAYSKGADSAELYQSVLGRKGSLTLLLRTLKDLPENDRRDLGAAANTLRQELSALLQAPPAQKGTENASFVDLSVPAALPGTGAVHPISAMIEEMTGIFRDLSFEIVEGNEIVTDEDNFESLNITTDHPARDGMDTFFLTETLLLRTQTSAIQVMEMRRRLTEDKVPIRIVAPGKTYRRESDQTHSAMFHQIEGVQVDTQTTFADLKGILEYFVRRLYGDSVETRFRPHYFPFTEPSAEMDIRIRNANGTGKHTGWLEMLGCGMIHPAVLRRAGLNPKVYRGWAFGMSVERPLMIRHQIPDLRLLFSNSQPFLSQFKS